MRQYRHVVIPSLIIAMLCTATTQAANPKAFELIDATIGSVHHAIKEHQLTCTQLVKDYLTRIKTYDLSLNRGAPINAFVSLNPNIMTQAKALDSYYSRTGHFKGPLHCIPVIVKDNIDTIDTPSTSGSLSLLGSQPIHNAFLVNKIRRAGGLIIGKGAMDEFASGMSGISSKSGRVGNAYDPTQNPGGSSAGPGAAVSANFAMIGIGTDNSGSVRIPAAYNGINGIRPSTGLISQSGIFPRGNLDGVPGVMARTIKDLAITLSVIADTADPSDPKTQAVPHNIASYTQYLNANALKGQRIGIITRVGGKKTFDLKNTQAMSIFKHTFAKFKQEGATLINITLPRFNSQRDDNMAGEIQDINRYLASFPSTRQNFKDICSSNRTQTFGNVKKCLDHIHNTAPHNSTVYQHVLRLFSKNRRYVKTIMKNNHLSAMLMPLNAEGGPSYNTRRVNTWRAAVSSNAGLPAISFIGGYTHSHPAMPVGLELIGKPYDEGHLIGLAYSYEHHSPPRQRPTLLQSKYKSPLLTMSIPQINNLFTVIGYKAYRQFLQRTHKQTINAPEFSKLVHDVLWKK